MVMKQKEQKSDLDRRSVLKLALWSASALVLGRSKHALAQQAKGVETKVYKEAESMIPGFAKIRLRERIYQPGASGTKEGSKMRNAMICECTQGTLEVRQNGKTFTANKGDIWTCREGIVEETINKGNTIAIMRVFDLMKS